MNNKELNNIEKLNIEQLKNFCSLTNGVTMGQLKEITKTSSCSIQNWINRGWVPHPVAKKYSINHIARIMIIKNLKSILSFDKISFILSYINGDVDDTSDEIIDEAELYSYIYTLADNTKLSYTANDEILDNTIKKCLENYKERFVGSYQRLFKALKIISLAYYSAYLKDKCLEMMKTLQTENL